MRKLIKKFGELNEATSNNITSLLIFRLYDKNYGRGNQKTLSVFLRPDNTLAYSFYGGWQNSGMGFAISNLQLKKSLPTSATAFKNVKQLQTEIESVLSTGVGSRWIDRVEKLNDLPKPEKTPKSDDSKVGSKVDINKLVAKLKYLTNVEDNEKSQTVWNLRKLNLQKIRALLDANFPDITAAPEE